MTDAPESAAAVAHRMRAWQEGHLSGMDNAVILGAVRDAVNEASASLRAVRDWCDMADQIICSHTSEHECVRCEAIRDCASAIRSLLPDVPPAAEGVEQVDGTRVTPGEDREY